MKINRLAKYLLITYSISWIVWGALILLINHGVTTYASPLGFIIFTTGGFGPTIAAIAVQEKRTPKAILRFVFGGNHKAWGYFLLFCVLLTAVIGLSSGTLNPAMPLLLAPLYLFLMTAFGGGNEELGWRGFMQPALEKSLPFSIAVLLTSIVWSCWHLPCWLMQGSSQQAFPFFLFAAFALPLSFALAAIYFKTKCVFFCSLFHALSNVLMSLFIIQVNWVMIGGCIAIAVIAVLIRYTGTQKVNQREAIKP